MDGKNVFACLASLATASAFAAGNDLVKSVTVNTVALPAVQKPASDAKAVVAPAAVPVEVKNPAARKSGEVQPSAFEEKAMTVRTFTPGTLTSPRDPAQPPPAVDRVGIAKPGLPDGPMLSPLEDPRKPKAGKGDHLRKSDLDKKRQSLQDRKDSLGEMGQEDLVKLQQYQSQHEKMQDALGKTTRKAGDTQAGVVSNLK